MSIAEKVSNAIANASKPRASRSKAPTAETSEVAVRTASAQVDAMAPKANAEGVIVSKVVPINLDRALSCIEGACKPDGSKGDWEVFSVSARAKLEKAIAFASTGMQKITDTKAAIGEKLAALRSDCTTGQWKAVTSYILPMIGISESSSKRWIAMSLRSQVLLPNKAVRDVVLMLGDGNGIIVEKEIEETHEDGKVSTRKEFVLSEYFEQAMEALPLPADAKPSQIEEFARTWVKVANKKRAGERNGDKAHGVQRKALLKRAEIVCKDHDAGSFAWCIAEVVKQFAAKHGKDMAASLMATLDKTVASGNYAPAASYTQSSAVAKSEAA